ncbi:hypothetical protein ACGFZQ_36315 [Streptomyces sp. NPDC048254]|jgi:hypothetical protein|nr:hypothetical protein [Streptomyces sp.]
MVLGAKKMYTIQYDQRVALDRAGDVSATAQAPEGTCTAPGSD